MIKEYALDPNISFTLDKIRYYLEKFGYEKGRLISRYPKDWRKTFKENLKKTMADREYKRAEILLDRRLSDIIWDTKRRGFDRELGWLENAEREHESKPFSAIISDSNPSASEDVIIDEEVDEDHPKFRVPSRRQVKRTPQEISKYLSPILKKSKRLLLIDPYFEPKPCIVKGPQPFTSTRWISPLIGFLTLVKSDCKVEYHTLLHSKRPFEESEWEKQCTIELPELLPMNSSLSIHLWELKDGQRQFHDRNIATDECAMIVDPGLDASKHTAHEVFEVTFLGTQDKDELLERFEEKKSPYKLVTKKIVKGTGECLTPKFLESFQ